MFNFLKKPCTSCEGKGFTNTGHYDDHGLGLAYPEMSESKKEKLLRGPLRDPVTCKVCEGNGYKKISLHQYLISLYSKK